MNRIPKAIGPYSLFLKGHPGKTPFYFSGVIGVSPETGNIESRDFASEVDQALVNLQSVLAMANVDRVDVVKTTCFLTSMDYFTEMNGIYAKFFGDHKPARSTVAVQGLPKGARFEIEVIALK